MRQMRKDDVTARKIDSALVRQQIRGTADARRYLQAESIAEAVIERVLAGHSARSVRTGAAVNAALEAAVGAKAGTTAEAAPAEPARPSLYCATGRRRDVLRAAMVQAAIALLDRDADRARRLLQREGLPDDVIVRVLGDGPRRGQHVPRAQ